MNTILEIKKLLKIYSAKKKTKTKKDNEYVQRI